MPKPCEHPAESVKSGPRVRLRWGTAETEVCKLCGAYRTMHHGPGRWLPGPVAPIRDDDDED